MAFVQIIDYRCSRFDEMQKLGEEWEAAAADTSTTQRVVMGRDRNDPDHFLTMAFFESYESAMENSDNPVTQEFSQKMGALADGPPTFYDLDVVRDEVR
jgi:hypothetical protein